MILFENKLKSTRALLEMLRALGVSNNQVKISLARLNQIEMWISMDLIMRDMERDLYNFPPKADQDDHEDDQEIGPFEGLLKLLRNQL